MAILDSNYEHWGKSPEGDAISLYILRNSSGMEARITNYGCRVVSLDVPNRNGEQVDVALGFDNIEQYLGKNPHFGALTGRFAGRIRDGRFTLDGRTIQLPLNDSRNSIHGGPNGFDRRIFSGRILEADRSSSLELKYTSKDGEEGFPGNLDLTVIYSITPQNELRIEYVATVDRPTIVNLTNHSYFNLAGAGSGDVRDCLLTINADLIAPTDRAQIPTGDIVSVAGTPFDFRVPTAIGARIDSDDEQLKIGGGYDATYLIDRSENTGPIFAARVIDPKSGLTMDVYTTQPALQLYTACKLDGTIVGKEGKAYGRFGAVCLETVHIQDAPNHPNFPSTVLRPGELYRHETIYRFIA